MYADVDENGYCIGCGSIAVGPGASMAHAILLRCKMAEEDYDRRSKEYLDTLIQMERATAERDELRDILRRYLAELSTDSRPIRRELREQLVALIRDEATEPYSALDG